MTQPRNSDIEGVALDEEPAAPELEAPLSESQAEQTAHQEPTNPQEKRESDTQRVRIVKGDATKTRYDDDAKPTRNSPGRGLGRRRFSLRGEDETDSQRPNERNRTRNRQS